VLRTSSGFFFNLDVTQRESADAKEGFVSAIALQVSLKNPTQESLTRKEKGILKPDISVEFNTRSIYRFLRRTFGQCVTVAKIVHLNISDIVTVRNIHLTIHRACNIACAGRG
jgi:hypothetical protein